MTGAVALGLTSLPLVGSLGYEHAFVTGPLAAAGGIAVGVESIAHARAAGPSRILDVFAAGARELAILLAIVLGLTLVGQLWQATCEPLGGLGFFVVGPVASAFVGLTAGIAGGILGRTRRRQLAWAASFMLVSIAIGVWRLIAEPVVFAYDAFWGYFSGAIYDEGVTVSDTLLRFRLYNACGVLAVLCSASLVTDKALRLRRPTPRRAPVRTIVAAALACTAVAVGARASSFGFTADLASITEVLSGVRETEHFVIYYAPRSADARTIDAVVREHEFAWATLRAAMNGREPDGKVTSFVFANSDQKRRMMGAGTVQVAAPWRRQIYLDHRDFPHPVLHHELAHIFGATVGDPLFGVAFSGGKLNMGLIEGFATALAPRESDRLDLHDQAVVLQRLGKLPAMKAIMGPGFFTKASQVAYTAAGSFCLHLVETRGFEPMGVLYGSAGDFEAAYGTPLETLETEWLAMLSAREGVRDQDVEAAALRFKRASVFERPCAHRTAELRVEIDRAVARGRFEEAVAGYERLCELEPEQPDHLLGLARTLAVAGRPTEAADVLARAAQMPDLPTATRAAIAERKGDVELVAGNLEAARVAYDEAAAQPQPESRMRLLQVRRVATSDAALARLVLAYLSPFDATDDDVVHAVTASWAAREMSRLPEHAALGEYLLGRQLMAAERPAAAAASLERALVDDGIGLPTPELLRAARVALLEAYTMTERWADARALLARLRRDPDQPNGYLAQWEDWRERLDFFEADALTARE